MALPLTRPRLPRFPLLPRELHETDRPSATAQATTLGRALELDRPVDERIVSDRFAPIFLDAVARRVLAGLQAARSAVRVAERSSLAGVATSALCRHGFIDAHLLEALPDVEQVLILGAGYDSRAYRFTRAIGGRPVFEVDLAPLSRAKRQIVAAHPDDFGSTSVHAVEIDFRTQTLAGQLAGTAFRPGARTFVAWEGVAMYLDAAAVRGTLAAVSELCGARSLLTMDCWQHARGRSVADQVRRAGERGLALIGEPVTFAVPAHRVGPLLESAGLRLVDLATSDTLATRFATAGRRCDPGLYALAARVT